MLEINHVYQGHCLDVMKKIDDNSIDSIVTDPPYGISFMNKKWDYDVPSVDTWEECLRVLKPGGHLLSFAGTRTQHRMCCNIEDAGFEIRDMMAWVYGSGFPKSHNISKAIDKSLGKKRRVVGKRQHPTLKDKKRVDRCESTQYHGKNSTKDEWDITESCSADAQEWEGWGTALKPALEPITLARKPLSGKTVASNVLKWGTGGINIDGCRVETDGRPKREVHALRPDVEYGGNSYEGRVDGNSLGSSKAVGITTQGRFPANLIHDGSEETLGVFPVTKSGGGNKANIKKTRKSQVIPTVDTGEIYSPNAGSAARFFYCAKASKSERGEGNDHPTVKPIKLIEYLVRLITPVGGVCLDCFCGSGGTGVACVNLGFNYILIDKEKHYVGISKSRVSNAIEIKESSLF